MADIKRRSRLTTSLGLIATSLVMIPLYAQAVTLAPVFKGVGAVNYPTAFYLGFDGNLWGDAWSGSAWNPRNLGTPSGVNITGAIGTLVNGSDEQVFVTGADGNLWQALWNGTTWKWQNLSQPSSASISGAVGAVVNGVDVQTFITGSDGNLWQALWNGSAWKWQDLGNPGSAAISASIGAVANGGHVQAFITGSDGNLWADAWSGSAWNWQNLGTPSGVNITGAAGTVASGNDEQVFITGSDGNLWQDFWNGSTWKWQNLGNPGSIALSGSLGALVNGNDVQVFLEGGDGNLWQALWNGSVWKWQNLKNPGTANIAGPIGAVADDNGNHVQVFIRGDDGNLWQNSWNGSTWTWQNLSIASLGTGNLNLKYQILHVDYAPPGNSLSGIHNIVNYANTTMRSTTTTNTQSWANTVNVSDEYTWGTKQNGLTAGTAFTYSQQEQNTNSVIISTTNTNTDNYQGPSTAGTVDHDYDQIYLWMNPMAIFASTGNPSYIQWNGYTVNTADPNNPNGMDIYWVYAGELNGDFPMRSGTVAELLRSWDTSGLGGLTTADYAAILNADPFEVSSGYNPVSDPTHRFVSVNEYEYAPPAPGAGETYETYQMINSITNNTSTSATVNYSVGYTLEDAGPLVGMGSFDNKVSDTYTTTDATTKQKSVANSNNASFTLYQPPAGYSGCQVLQVWQDVVYGTFMFYIPPPVNGVCQ